VRDKVFLRDTHGVHRQLTGLLNAAAGFHRTQGLKNTDGHKKTDQGSLEPTVSDTVVHLTLSLSMLSFVSLDNIYL